MSDSKLTISFTLIDECGNEYTATSKEGAVNDIHESDLEFIGRQLNAFLKQCGYYRKRDNILMSDLTDEEYDELLGYLEALRGKNRQ